MCFLWGEEHEERLTALVRQLYRRVTVRNWQEPCVRDGWWARAWAALQSCTHTKHLPQCADTRFHIHAFTGAISSVCTFIHRPSHMGFHATHLYCVTPTNQKTQCTRLYPYVPDEWLLLVPTVLSLPGAASTCLLRGPAQKQDGGSVFGVCSVLLLYIFFPLFLVLPPGSRPLSFWRLTLCCWAQCWPDQG